MHGQVHVVLVRVEGRVVIVLVIVVVVVQRGQGMQWGHVGRRGKPGYDYLVVHPALRRSRRVAATRRDKQGSLYRLGVRRGRWVGLGWVFWGRTHTWPLGFCDGLRWWSDPLPCII